MILMRAVHRAIAATALGLPLLLAGPGMALADGGQKPHKPQKPDVDISQPQDADVDQTNNNDPLVVQSGVDNTANVPTSQTNWSYLDQQAEVEKGKDKHKD
jgi:hypothetical protein